MPEVGEPNQERLPFRRRLNRRLNALGCLLAPPVFRAWMRLVEKTSRIHDHGGNALLARVADGERVVAILPHQDCLTLPWLFRGNGFGTVASIGDAGNVIAAVLATIGFDVKRGGSSRGNSRRSPVFSELTGYARSRGEGGFLLAITPDGSRGPALACNPGYVFVALRSRANIYCIKVHSRRARYLNTWDATAIPLPFSDITVEVEGPFTLPKRPTRVELDEMHKTTEAALHGLQRKVFADAGQPMKPAVLTCYGEEQRTDYRSPVASSQTAP